jgi:hypothetical protein
MINCGSGRCDGTEGKETLTLVRMETVPTFERDSARLVASPDGLG